jgi:hypothetical protein
MIRVLIERRIREGAGAEYERTQRELRFEALREHGYLTGKRGGTSTTRSTTS